MDGDAHDKADRALEVVRELHKRYEAQDQRWHNYSKLIGFICFAGLLLAVLYLQRDAHVLYQVHSTIAASVLPEDITSPTDVLDWLQAFLQVSGYSLVLVCQKQRLSDVYARLTTHHTSCRKPGLIQLVETACASLLLNLHLMDVSDVGLIAAGCQNL